MRKAKIAYQIYSAREEAEKDLDGVLASLKAMGYDGVEFAGFYGNTAKEVKAMLDKHGLEAVSSHVPSFQIEEDMFGIIAYHQAIGCPYIAVPYLDDDTRPGAPGFSRMIAMMYKFGSLCKEAGIQLLYHNHDFEFITLSGQYGLDFIYDAIPADILKTEIDTCWVKFSGIDPAEYIKKYAGRCPVVHMKDFVGKKGDVLPYALIGLTEQKLEDGQSIFEFRPVGYGSQDVEAIVKSALASGAQWLIVEQDLSIGRTPLEAAEMSIGTLVKYV